jgi:hypothetical protein
MYSPGYPQKPMLQKIHTRGMGLFEFPMYVFLPWLIFAATFALVSLPCHYNSPNTTFVGCGIILAVVLVLGTKALSAWRSNIGGFEAKGAGLLFLSSLIAWVVAGACGQVNFLTNIKPFMDIENLNEYSSVDPSTSHGQLMMDGGRIHFVEGAQLDLNKSASFKNDDYFCVAPITKAGAGALEAYDFWAVGFNCCTGRNNFQCGDNATSTVAMSGLRLMRPEHQGFYRLAVQQAEAAYNIQARHPIFLHWLQDPTAAIEEYANRGYGYLLLGILIFIIFQLCACGLAYAKFGL